MLMESVFPIAPSLKYRIYASTTQLLNFATKNTFRRIIINYRKLTELEFSAISATKHLTSIRRHQWSHQTGPSDNFSEFTGGWLSLVSGLWKMVWAGAAPQLPQAISSERSCRVMFMLWSTLDRLYRQKVFQSAPDGNFKENYTDCTFISYPYRDYLTLKNFFVLQNLSCLNSEWPHVRGLTQRTWFCDDQGQIRRPDHRRV